jgi:hypothetical protein
VRYWLRFLHCISTRARARTHTHTHTQIYIYISVICKAWTFRTRSDCIVFFLFFNGIDTPYNALVSSVCRSVIIFYTDGTTPWTSDKPVAKPLPIHRTTQTQNKRIHRHQCLEWDSNPRSRCSRERRQCMS